MGKSPLRRRRCIKKKKINKMRTILYLIRKEFLQIFRNKFISKAIFGVPIVQMLILVPAITFEIKDVRLCLIDRDMSAGSRALISQLEGSTFFKIKYSTFSEEEANKLLHSNKCDLILHIPQEFGKEYRNRRSRQGPCHNKCHQCLNSPAFLGIS